MRGSRPLLQLFVLSLLASISMPANAATVVRGPYLQQVTQTSITVRWRTSSTTTDAVVRYGAAPGNLGSTASSSQSGTEHVVTVSGLTPGTRYYYSVGDWNGPLAGNDATHFFSTSPPNGSSGNTRIWVIGDSGLPGPSPAAVRDAYLGYATAEGPADIWLMLGDNAYDDGTDAEHQPAVFDMYPTILRNTPLWTTLGNHDGDTINPNTGKPPYYDIFTLPQNAEAGGVVSGTEAYYSFDYGDIHFVVLDSYLTDRSPTGDMMLWLASDLAATDKKWLIAFWHHPPYSKGTHDTDDQPNEEESFDMRERALPILESYGVDLVLTGHSHVYERSKFIDGHYGLSASFNPATMQISGESGREDVTGAYSKSVLMSSSRGTVYAVVGSSSRLDPDYFKGFGHPVMYFELQDLGSMLLDIDGDRLDAKFIDSTGAQRDYFTILKDFDGDGLADDMDPDGDNDDMPDTFENDHGLDPYDPDDADLDPDVDGLTSLQEFMKDPGLDPNDPDTDDDGIGDALDDNPTVSDSVCNEGDPNNRILANVLITEPSTCGARQTITVKPTTEVQNPAGELHLIAPVVIFQSGFSAGSLSVLLVDACAGCP